MQAGLMNTYQHPASNRSWLAWALSALLFAAYILLYFGPLPALGLRFDLLQRAAEVRGRGARAAGWSCTASGSSTGPSTRWR